MAKTDTATMREEKGRKGAFSMDRRSFIKWSGALASIPALGQLAACSPEQAQQAATQAEGINEDEGEWKPYRCFRLYCSASCINYALVQDGQVVRVKTDDRHPDDPEDMPQQRGCLRGQAKRNNVYGPDRLKYPMKRKNWEPGGDPSKIHGELRGKDEWVRISWDEALDIIADELKRIIGDYGNEAVMRTGLYPNSVLSAMGGSQGGCGGNSQGGWVYPSSMMTGYQNLAGYYGAYLYNDRIDLLNAKLIVLDGNNPSWSALGYPNKVLLDAKRRGAKIIGINPFYNSGLGAIADEWVPIRPATDAALFIACAYHMIENNLQDQEFLDKYTVGFDADHMPEGADPKDNFKDYVLGTYDGVPKTPEWASEICGTDPEVIRSLATDMATIKPASIFSCSAVTRGFRGEQAAQAFFTLGWMTGNVGKPGACVADMSGQMVCNGGGPLVSPGGEGRSEYANVDPVANLFLLSAATVPTDGMFGVTSQQKWRAVVDGQYLNGKWGMRDIDVRCIWDIGRGNKLNSEPGTPLGIEAFRKVEFVVSCDCFLNTTAEYADIVLPMVMQWEHPANFSHTSNRDCLTYCSHVIDPLFEAKSDYEINRELATRLGFDPDELEITEEEIFANQLQGATVIKETGFSKLVGAGQAGPGGATTADNIDPDYEKLLTITAEDWANLGFPDREPQEGRVPLADFLRDGIYQVPRKEGDNFGYIALQAYVEDPEANPLNTESGKLEIYCRRLKEVVDLFGSYSISAIPKYEPPQEGYEDTFSDYANKVKGDYPLQLESPHSLGHHSSQLDNCRWMQEAHANAAYMNPIDAEERGLAQHDAVKIYNQRGAIIRVLKITPRVVPGVVLVADGGWTDYDEELGVDFGGNPNFLTSTDPCGCDIQPWNTVNAQVEKWEGDFQYDIDRPLRIIDLGE